MTERERLPNRRLCMVQKSQFKGVKWYLTVGFDAGGQVREVFTHNHRSGSDTEALMNDACVWLSILLQTGFSAADILARMGREARPAGATDPAPPASFLGFIAAEAVRLEAECGPDITAFHRGRAA